MATFTGSAGSNLLNGTNSADSMTGNAGNDTLNGLGGDDTIFGGTGNDSTSGGDGNDLIYSDYDISENLVVNGDFSSGSFGWTANNPTGGPGPIFTEGVASFNSEDEAVYGDSIEQTLNTVVGQLYNASYRGIENNIGVGNHTVQVDILDAFGAVIYTRTDVIGNSTNRAYTFSFTSTTAQTTIRFTNTFATNTVSSDLKIDQVSVVGPIDPIGNDTVDGGNGDDTIYAGAGVDLVFGGAGNDLIYAEAGNDEVYFGAGDDTVYGGDGDDTIDDLGGIPFLLGNNLIYGGAGNDLLWDATGNDTMYGGDGNDSIYGDNAGDDRYFGGLGDDALGGGIGADTLYGGDGADQVFGDSGDDLLFGGAGADTLNGGTGRDTLDGGEGADSLTGGSGADVFIAQGADTITDFDAVTGISNNGSEDNDFVDLSGYYNLANLALWNAANPTQQYDTPLKWLRADQADGILQSAQGLRILNGGVAVDANLLRPENTAVCFAQGTRLNTAKGHRPIEKLRVGDFVQTADHGMQPIRWIGRMTVDALGDLAPIRISAGALGNRRDIYVSPLHRMVLSGWNVQLMFGEAEVLAAAKMLINGTTICPQPMERVRYYHLMFDAHEIVFAEGARAESFHPGAEGFDALGADALAQIGRVFPALAAGDFAAYGPSARRSLRSHEARLLHMGRTLQQTGQLQSPPRKRAVAAS